MRKPVRHRKGGGWVQKSRKMNMNQLPRKGLIYSFDSVEIGDEVIVSPEYGLNTDPVIIEIQREEVMRRAKELDAELAWYRKPVNLHDPDIAVLKIFKP